jgi:outer membrane receptor protein involved in Fe transport
VFLGELDTLNYNSALTLYHYSVFGQASRSFMSDRLTLSFGLRADGTTFDKEMANPLTQLSPRLAASYTLRENLLLNASTGRYFQRPAYTTLGFRDQSGNLGNKDNGLAFSGSNHFVAGFEYHPNRTARLSLEGVFKSYFNYPFSVTDSILASKGGGFGTFGDEEVGSESEGLRLWIGALIIVSGDLWLQCNTIIYLSPQRISDADGKLLRQPGITGICEIFVFPSL